MHTVEVTSYRCKNLIAVTHIFLARPNHWTTSSTSTRATLKYAGERYLAMATQQQLSDGLCLRFSGDIQNQPALTIEAAVNMLIRGTQASLQVPFSWGYIDRPAGI